MKPNGRIDIGDAIINILKDCRRERESGWLCGVSSPRASYWLCGLDSKGMIALACICTWDLPQLMCRDKELIRPIKEQLNKYLWLFILVKYERAYIKEKCTMKLLYGLLERTKSYSAIRSGKF